MLNVTEEDLLTYFLSLYHRGVGVSGTDQLSLSPLSEKEGPDQPLSIKSYDTASVHLQHVGNNGIWSPGFCTPANTPIPTSEECFACTPEMERETRVELRSRLPCVNGLVRPITL